VLTDLDDGRPNRLRHGDPGPHVSRLALAFRSTGPLQAASKNATAPPTNKARVDEISNLRFMSSYLAPVARMVKRVFEYLSLSDGSRLRWSILK